MTPGDDSNNACNAVILETEPGMEPAIEVPSRFSCLYNPHTGKQTCRQSRDENNNTSVAAAIVPQRSEGGQHVVQLQLDGIRA